MIRNFQIFEENNGFLEDEIDGFKYWFFIRDKLYSRLIGLTAEVKSSKEYSGLTSKVTDYVDKLTGSSDLSTSSKRVNFFDILHLIKNVLAPDYRKFNREKEILLFSSPRRVYKEGKYFSIYTDYLYEMFPGKCVTAEFPNGLTHLRPAWCGDVIEMDAVDIIPFVRGEISKKLRKKEKNIFIEKGEKISAAVREMTGELPDSHELANMIETRYYWYRYKRPVIKKFIERINPKVIVEIGGYGRNTLIVNEIAKELSIPTIELQHGIIGTGHIAYNYLKKRKYFNLPDKLCVFSDYWKRTCSFPIGEENIIVTGFPYFDEQRRLFPKISDKERTQVLFLSQPVFSGALSDIALSFAKRTGENKDMRIIYKLHPLEYAHSDEFKSKFSNCQNVAVICDSDKSLYELFSESDIQVGATSTSIFEGLGYGLRTYIADIGDASSRMNDLIQSHYASLIRNADELYNLILSENNSNENDVSNEFFYDGAFENISRVINSVIGKE